MTDFSTVRVCLVFEKHPTQDVAEMLNQEYGGLIEPDFLIVGDDMQNAVIIDNPLVAIKAHIVNLLIELGIQTSGVDEDAKRTTIGPLFLRAPIKLLVNGGQPQRRITKDNVTEAFTAARSDASQTLFIKVGISHLFFNMDEHQTFLNWDNDRVRTDSAFPVSTASATAPTAPTPPTTTSGPIPSSADITSMANAFAAAFTAAAPAPAPAPAPTPAPIPTAGTAYSGLTSLFTFNRNAFPPDVQSRIQDKENGTPIIGSDIKQSFVSGFMDYHNTGQGILVSTDGSVFVDRAVYDEKNISKHYISFANTTHSGIRSAYELLTLHLTDHGVYCHPLYCFRPSSLKWGFSCGNSPDDDVPLKFNIDLKAWSGLIARYLGNEKVIAKNNTLHGIVQSCGGDGYAALMNIIQSSHPAYHETPSILLQKYPPTAKRRIASPQIILQAYPDETISVTHNSLSLSGRTNESTYGPYFPENVEDGPFAIVVPILEDTNLPIKRVYSLHENGMNYLVRESNKPEDQVLEPDVACYGPVRWEDGGWESDWELDSD